ncbi:MAG TPA: hypothetical protein PKO06_12965 [Candidatus Ozemobacteraceae bacterium]|nr:hypothetical protein [Candidatus Ozemobacteraceae bacterium]
MNFKLTMVDTHPYGKNDFGPKTVDGVTIEQKLAKINPEFYYAYPVYNYSTKDGIKVTDFSSANNDIMKVGMLDFHNSPSGHGTPIEFKGTKYDVQWVWKKATTVNATTKNQVTEQKNGLDVGGTWTVEGTVNLGVPTPWHVVSDSTEYTAHSKTYPKPVFKVFCLCEDSAGHKWPVFGNFIDDTSKTTAAEEWTEMKNPETGGDYKQSILAADKQLAGSPDIADIVQAKTGNAGTDFSWQQVASYTAEDKSKPEIQVIVFDTRNNSYHIFGSRNGGDALAATKPNAPVNYTGMTPAPFSTTDLDTLTGEYKFETMDVGLFETFFKTTSQKGVNLLDDHKGHGIVCQKNTRLIFYIRAWDNVNTFNDAEKFGINTLEFKVVDATWNGGADEQPPASDRTPYSTSYDLANLTTNPPMWQFRADNVDSGADCHLEVKATDKAGNATDFMLKVFVTGKEIEIRSLEEKRNRLSN